MKADFEKNLLRTQLEIQEQTFQDISREIHDRIGLSLTMAKLNLNMIDWSNATVAQEKVNGSIDFISNVIENLRDISKTLHTDYISDQGLLNAVEQEVHKIDRLGLYRIRYEVTGTPVFLDTQKDLVVFRMIQELLNNCIKHSEAQEIFLSFHYNEAHLKVKISDNGKGFRLENIKVSQRSGTGILNIKKRAKVINGICNIYSVQGKGTTITIEIPY